MAEGEEKMNGQRATEVRPAAKARGNNWRLNSKTQRGRASAGQKARGRKKPKKERKEMRTGRHWARRGEEKEAR